MLGGDLELGSVMSFQRWQRGMQHWLNEGCCCLVHRGRIVARLRASHDGFRTYMCHRKLIPMFASWIPGAILLNNVLYILKELWKFATRELTDIFIEKLGRIRAMFYVIACLSSIFLFHEYLDMNTFEPEIHSFIALHISGTEFQ
jgi:hypothetical protein